MRGIRRRHGRARRSRRLQGPIAPPRDMATRAVIPRTAAERATFYGAVERKAYDYWMGVGSQPGLMHSMSAAEHKRSAEKRRDQDEHVCTNTRLFFLNGTIKIVAVRRMVKRKRKSFHIKFLQCNQSV